MSANSNGLHHVAPVNKQEQQPLVMAPNALHCTLLCYSHFVSGLVGHTVLPICNGLHNGRRFLFHKILGHCQDRSFPSMAPLTARLVLLSKTISLTIEAIFLGSQVPGGYTKNKQAAALLTCDTAQWSSVVGYPLYQS